MKVKAASVFIDNQFDSAKYLLMVLLILIYTLFILGLCALCVKISKDTNKNEMEYFLMILNSKKARRANPGNGTCPSLFKSLFIYI